jgi:hypothetical protein
VRQIQAMPEATRREWGMKPKGNWIELSVICALFILLSVAGIISSITSGLLTSGIDGIMMLFVCLMMGGIFTLMLLYVLHQAGMIPGFRKAEAKVAAKAAPAAAKASAPAPGSTNPAAQPSSQPK